MFFPGTLQEAVALGIEQNRALACFVTDGAGESATWESTYLTDEEATPLLAQCVLIRLQAGSVEAGFLAAFCPIQDVPYFTVIKHGSLVANMKAGDSREEFMKLLKGAFAEPHGTPGTAAVQASPAPAPASAPATSTAPPRVQESSSEVLERTGNSLFLQQQRRRRQAATEERQRVLRLLENDKKEREARQGKNMAEDKAPSASIAGSGGQGAPKSRSPGETAISFRMLDGVSLRAKFPSSAVLASDVRKFVDEHRTDGDHPYNFLQILTPLPNKHITISEENSTLGQLGLSPTCTLVLVPASSSPVSAYSGGGRSTEGGGIFSRIYGMFHPIVTIPVVGYHPPVPAPVNAELGKSQSLPTVPFSSLMDASASSSSSGEAPSRGEAPSTRITLYDGRRSGRGEADRKYYNGNQLDFEPRKDGGSSDGDGN